MVLTMPIEVDEAERLDEIAAATIRLAKERDVRAVTIRAVAEQLGRSTTVITNYIPSRIDLMINALRHADKELAREAEEVMRGTEGAESLRALSRWMCSTTPEDVVIRRLLQEVLIAGASIGPANQEVLRAISRGHHDHLADVVVEAGLRHAELVTDILHLLFRGYWMAAMEDPERWPAEAGVAAVLAVIDLLNGEDT